MGRSYKYQCESCYFNAEYFIGGGFFTEDYFSESERLTQEFRSDVINGKYGTLLQALARADVNNELRYDCETHLYQCNHCFALSVSRGKLMYKKRTFDAETQGEPHYDLLVEIEQICSECSKGKLEKIDYSHMALCPKCKKEYLKLISFGFWD